MCNVSGAISVAHFIHPVKGVYVSSSEDPESN